MDASRENGDGKTPTCPPFPRHESLRLEEGAGLAVPWSSAQSPKPPKAHGYGLKIVRKTLDEHEGMLDVGVKDGWFVASFMLPAEKVASV